MTTKLEEMVSNVWPCTCPEPSIMRECGFDDGEHGPGCPSHEQARALALAEAVVEMCAVVIPQVITKDVSGLHRDHVDRVQAAIRSIAKETT